MTKQEFIDKHFRGCSPEYFDIVSSDLDAVIAGGGDKVKDEFIDKHIKIVMAKTADAIRYELEQMENAIKSKFSDGMPVRVLFDISGHEIPIGNIVHIQKGAECEEPDHWAVYLNHHTPVYISEAEIEPYTEEVPVPDTAREDRIWEAAVMFGQALASNPKVADQFPEDVVDEFANDAYGFATSLYDKVYGKSNKK